LKSKQKNHDKNCCNPKNLAQETTTEKINKNTILILILCIIFTGLILILPIQLRGKLHSPSLPGEKNYDDIRTIDQIREEGIKTKYSDSTSIKEEYRQATPFHYLAGILIKGNLIKSIQIINAMFGIISVLLFFLILKRLGCKNTEATIAIIFLITTPLFMHTFIYSGTIAMTLFLTLLGTYIFLNTNPWIKASSAAIFFILPIFNALYGILLLSALIIFFMQNKNPENKQETLLISIIMGAIIISTIISAMFFQQAGLYEYPRFIERNPIQEMISETGGKSGFSMFIILLAIAGSTILWKKKKITPYFMLLIIMLVYGVLINSNTNIFINLGAAYLAAVGATHITRMKWEVDIIKSLTITLIICGILFTMIIQLNLIIKDGPDQEINTATELLKNTGSDKEAALSHYLNSQWIKNSGKKAILDADPRIDNRKIYEDTNNLFYTRDVTYMNELMKKYDIKYIWIDERMRKGLVWQKEDEGLQLLLEKSKMFTKIYVSDEITIWEYHD